VDDFKPFGDIDVVRQPTTILLRFPHVRFHQATTVP
jgi:hypothetical protein